MRFQQKEFFHQAAIIDSYCDSNKILIQQIAIQKLECEKFQKQIEEHIQWKGSDVGKKANLPQIDKYQKELLFTEWKMHIAKAQKEAIRTSRKSTEAIQHLCDQLFKTGLLEENTSDVFSMTKEVEEKWAQKIDQ